MKALNPSTLTATVTELRGEIEALPRNSAGKRRGITHAQRKRAVEAFSLSGQSMTDFARLLAVNPATLFHWIKEEGGAKKTATAAKPAPRPAPAGFKKMTVIEETPPRSSSFTVEGPNGIRMTGLQADDVARLWRALC